MKLVMHFHQAPTFSGSTANPSFSKWEALAKEVVISDWMVEIVDHISRFSTRAAAAFLSRAAMASAMTVTCPFMAVLSASRAMALPFSFW